LLFIHATATDVSKPPLNAMPTFWPTGRDERTFDIPVSLTFGVGIPLEVKLLNRTYLHSPFRFPSMSVTIFFTY
jgi:hypothetical protein